MGISIFHCANENPRVFEDRANLSQNLSLLYIRQISRLHSRALKGVFSLLSSFNIAILDTLRLNMDELSSELIFDLFSELFWVETD